MKKRFTDEDIIRFLCDEMPQAESDALLTALVSDEDLWQRFEALQQTMESFSALSYEPAESSIQAIQSYVRESRPTQPAAQPELSQSSVSARSLRLGGITINLQVLVSMALAVFLALSVAGSAYKLTRQKFANPNTGKLVEREQPQAQPTQIDPRFDWEMNDIDQNLEKVKEGLETLEDKSLM